MWEKKTSQSIQDDSNVPLHSHSMVTRGSHTSNAKWLCIWSWLLQELCNLSSVNWSHCLETSPRPDLQLGNSNGLVWKYCMKHQGCVEQITADTFHFSPIESGKDLEVRFKVTHSHQGISESQKKLVFWFLLVVSCSQAFSWFGILIISLLVWRYADNKMKNTAATTLCN